MLSLAAVALSAASLAASAATAGASRAARHGAEGRRHAVAAQPPAHLILRRGRGGAGADVDNVEASPVSAPAEARKSRSRRIGEQEDDPAAIAAVLVSGLVLY